MSPALPGPVVFLADLSLFLCPSQLSGGCELTVVIHDFTACNSNELTIRRGQTVEVLERPHDKPDWCLVRTTDRSPAAEGLVPCGSLCIAHSRSSMEMEGIFNHKGKRHGNLRGCLITVCSDSRIRKVEEGRMSASKGQLWGRGGGASSAGASTILKWRRKSRHHFLPVCLKWAGEATDEVGLNPASFESGIHVAFLCCHSIPGDQIWAQSYLATRFIVV